MQSWDTGDSGVSGAIPPAPLPPTPTYRSTPRVQHPHHKKRKWEERDRFGAGEGGDAGSWARVPLSQTFVETVLS